MGKNIKSVVEWYCSALFDNVFICDFAQNIFWSGVCMLTDTDIFSIGVATNIHFRGIISRAYFFG
jgi:hypothetical protein